MYTRDFNFDHPMARNSRSLQDVLRERSLSVRAAIEKEMRGVLDTHADDSAYIISVVSRFSVKIPQFDFDPEHIKKVEEYEQMLGSYQGIFPNRSVRAWVVNFGFPYIGDIDYLRYIPPSGTGGAIPQFTYDGEYMWFRAWIPDLPDKDTQKIKVEKEKAIAFLQKRLADITPEIESFNQQLRMSVQTLFENLKQRYRKDKDILAQL